MQNFLLPTPLAQSLHDYLMTRPMQEAEPFVLALRKLELAPPPAAAPDTTIEQE